MIERKFCSLSRVPEQYSLSLITKLRARLTRSETQRNLLRRTSLRQLYTCKSSKISYSSTNSRSGANKLCSLIQQVTLMTRNTADHSPRLIHCFKEPSLRSEKSNTLKISTLLARSEMHCVRH